MRIVRRLVIVLGVLSLVPMALLLGGALLAGLMGCEVNEAGSTPCIVAGMDFGGLLSGLVATGWLELIILPMFMGLLALWGVVDRRLVRRTRGMLIAAPLVFLLAWLAMSAWGQMAEHNFGGAARLAETDISGSRFGIWANALSLIAQQPWLGVGFGEFNFAWSLTPFPGRPVAFFDHAHNLPLQLAAELVCRWRLRY